MSEYRMRPEYRQMFENFIEDVNKLRHVKIHMNHSYQPKRNKILLNSTNGNKLLLSFHSDMYDTVYAFNMSAGQFKNAENLKSIRMRGEKGKPISIISSESKTRGAVIRNVSPSLEDEYYKLSSQCMNQTSYSSLFIDENNKSFPSYGSIYVLEGTENPIIGDDKYGVYRNFQGLISAIFQESESAKATYFEWLLNKPVDFYQQSGITDTPDSYATMIRQMTVDYMLDHGYEVSEEHLRDVYGLNTLYETLENLDQELDKNPYLEVDLSMLLTDKDDSQKLSNRTLDLLQATNALAVYRTIKSLALDDNLTISETVHDHITYTNGYRTNCEKRYEANMAEYAKYCDNFAYPKLIDGMTSMVKDKVSVRNDVLYRAFYAECYQLSADKPLHIPLARVIYEGDPTQDFNINLAKIEIGGPEGFSCEKRFQYSLKEFVNGVDPIDKERCDRYKETVSKYPCLNDVTYDELRGYAEKALKSTEKKNESTTHDYMRQVDLLDLECRKFEDACNSGGNSGIVIHNVDVTKLKDSIQQTIADNYEGSDKPYLLAYGNEAGSPDSSKGRYGFGRLIVNALNHEGYDKIFEQEPGMRAEYHLMKDCVNGFQTSGNVRLKDVQMNAVLAKCTEGQYSYSNALSNNAMFAEYQILTTMLNTYNKETVKNDDAAKKAVMKQNDLLLLTDAYQISSMEDLKTLVQDIEDTYAQKATEGAYRPQNIFELTALRKLCQNGASIHDAIVSDPKTPFQQVFSDMLEKTENSQVFRDDLIKKLSTIAYDMDDVDTHPCMDVIESIEKKVLPVETIPDEYQKAVELYDNNKTEESPEDKSDDQYGFGE